MENQPIITPTREKSRLESGYSEEEQAKVIEGSQVDIKQVKKRTPVALDMQTKILNAYKKTHEVIVSLLEQLQGSPNNARYQDKIVEEIKELREVQEELMQCMLLEQRGELSEATASMRAWDLIK